jgi:hypothetical protein
MPAVMVLTSMRAFLTFFVIVTFSSFSAAGQHSELIAGAKWEFPGLAGPIAALEAPLGNPGSLAVANNGDLLIADVGNNIVLRLSSDGTLRVVAGNGVQAYSGDGGPATAASLINPAAIAVDKTGNIFIEDVGRANFMANGICGIRRVSPDGTISTIAAGAATCGTQIVPGIGFTVDPAGNPVVADQHFVRRINADGSSTTIAGSGSDASVCDSGAGGSATPSPIGDGGPATSAALSPGAIAYDSAGNLYIAEMLHPRIRKIDAKGIISTIAGLGSDCPMNYSPDGANAATAKIGNAGGLAFGLDGVLYLNEGLIVRTIANGTLSTALTQPPYLVPGHSPSPTGMAIDRSGAIVLTRGDRVVRATSTNSTQIIVGNGRFRSGGDGGPARLATVYDVMGLAADAAGNVYFTESDGNRVRKVSSDGVVSTIAGTGIGGCSDAGPAINAQLFLPYGIAADVSGGLYIAACDSVLHITPDGVITTISRGLASDVALDRQGNLYAAASGTVVRISPDGQATPVAGSSIPGAIPPVDGEPALNATLGISSVAVDPAGNLYLADEITQSIWVVNSSGIIVSKYADLNATRLVIDADGNLYAIGVDNRIYRVQPGRVSPIDGLANVVALAAGPDNTLLIARQKLDKDPLHADSEIRAVTVSDRRSARRF